MKIKSKVTFLLILQALLMTTTSTIGSVSAAEICNGPAAYPPDLPNCFAPVYIQELPSGKDLKTKVTFDLGYNNKKNTFKLKLNETARFAYPEIKKGTRVDSVIYTPSKGVFPIDSFTARKLLKNYSSPIIQFRLKGNYKLSTFLSKKVITATIQVR